MYQNNPTKVLSGECRLSYAHLCEPYSSVANGEPKYSTTLLIPKSDAATKADIDAAIKTAYLKGVTELWKGAQPQMRYPVIYDGDGNRPGGEPFGEECRGHWVITANSKQKPQVVHQSNINATLAPSDIYSGMYARVTMNFYPYDFNGNRGVGCGLGNVMKTRDGEPMGGRTTASNDFAGLGQAADPFGGMEPFTGANPWAV